MMQISSSGRAKPAPRDALGPRLRISLRVTLDCELLEGETPNVERIADQLAAYLERRDQHIGMIAAQDWALLIRHALVRRDEVTIDVAPERGPRS